MKEKIEEEIKIKAKQITNNLISFMAELDTETNKQVKELQLDVEFYKSEIEKLKCAEIAEKRIVELEAVNKRISDECHKLVDSLEKAQKENEELRDNFKIAKDNEYEYSSLLTKAKDLIENIIRVTWGEGWNYSLDWKVKAEQFLKEIEK